MEYSVKEERTNVEGTEFNAPAAIFTGEAFYNAHDHFHACDGKEWFSIGDAKESFLRACRNMELYPANDCVYERVGDTCTMSIKGSILVLPFRSFESIEAAAHAYGMTFNGQFRKQEEQRPARPAWTLEKEPARHPWDQQCHDIAAGCVVRRAMAYACIEGDVWTPVIYEEGDDMNSLFEKALDVSASQNCDFIFDCQGYGDWLETNVFKEDLTAPFSYGKAYGSTAVVRTKPKAFITLPIIYRPGDKLSTLKQKAASEYERIAPHGMKHLRPDVYHIVETAPKPVGYKGFLEYNIVDDRWGKDNLYAVRGNIIYVVNEYTLQRALETGLIKVKSNMKGAYINILHGQLYIGSYTTDMRAHDVAGIIFRALKGAKTQFLQDWSEPGALQDWFLYLHENLDMDVYVIPVRKRKVIVSGDFGGKEDCLEWVQEIQDEI